MAKMGLLAILVFATVTACGVAAYAEHAIVPAPDDTILYDDGALDSIISPAQYYWAVRFAPAQLCSVYSGLVALQAFPPLECSLFVWNDNSGQPQNPPAFRTAFMSQGLPAWNKVDLPLALVTNTPFWIGYRSVLAAPLPDAACDQSFPPAGISMYSSDGATWSPVPSGFASYYDLGIRALVHYFAARHDVLPTQIMLPDTVHCDMSYMVIATVLNQGDTTESFDMGVTIDTMGIVVYADTQQVLGLLASAETTIGFSPLWSVPVRDSVLYNVLVYTMLASDDSTANDTLQKNVYSYCYWIRDAGPVTVLSPGDTVHSDSTYQVQANVSNFGEVVESLDVECIITPGGYVDTQTVVGLSPGDTAVVSFTDWVAPAGDSTVYTMRVVTLLGVDAVHSNDSLSKNIFAYWLPQHDCGITAITSPPDTIFVGVKYAPVAVAHNWGNYTETFDAICTIDGYVDTQTVYSLAPQWSAMVVFDSFSTASAGSYTMNVRTALAGDLRAGNDTAFKTLEAVAGFSENLALPRTPASRLLQNAPNPFSRYTNIYCQIAEPGTIRLNVYNLAGRLVKVIFDGFAEPGCYSSIWQGDDETGNPVPSGVYIYKLTAGDFEASRKLVLVR